MSTRVSLAALAWVCWSAEEDGADGGTGNSGLAGQFLDRIHTWIRIPNYTAGPLIGKAGAKRKASMATKSHSE